jgi:hypothetical protein
MYRWTYVSKSYRTCWTDHVELMSNEAYHVQICWLYIFINLMYRWTWSTKLTHVQIRLNCVKPGTAASTMYRQSGSRLLLGQVLLEKASRCCRVVPAGASACRAASRGTLALPHRDPWRVNLDVPFSTVRQKLVQSHNKWVTTRRRFFLTKNIFYKNKAYTTWCGLQEYILTYIFSYIK